MKDKEIRSVRKAYNRVFHLLVKNVGNTNVEYARRLKNKEAKLDSLSTRLRGIKDFDPCNNNSCSLCKYMIGDKSAHMGMCDYFANVRENGEWIGFVKNLTRVI